MAGNEDRRPRRPTKSAAGAAKAAKAAKAGKAGKAAKAGTAAKAAKAATAGKAAQAGKAAKAAEAATTGGASRSRAARPTPAARVPELDAFVDGLLADRGRKRRPPPATKRLAEQLAARLGVETTADHEELRLRLTEELRKPDVAEALVRRVADALASSRPQPPRPSGGPRTRAGAAAAAAAQEAAPPAPPAPPEWVHATPGAGMAVVSWKASGTTVHDYVVTTSRVGPGRPKVVGETTVAGTSTRALVRDLEDGAEHSFTVHAVVVVGGNRIVGRPSKPTRPVVPQADLPGGVALLLLDEVPLGELFPSASADAGRNLLTTAEAVGQKWRYEHLKALAMKAAADALEYEHHIASLMAMTVSKITAAEALLNPTLIEVVNRASDIGSTVAGIADSASVDEILGSLAGAATDALMLPRFVLWLSQTSPIGFWIGLFEAMIEDVASFDGDLPRTRAFCRNALGSDLGGTFSAIRDAADDALDRLDTEVDAMVAPLRAAVSEVVAGTSRAMQDVFGAFDLPLTAGVGAGAEHVMNADPLAGLEEELLAKVDELALDLKNRISTGLQALRNATTGGDGFATLVVVYLAIPILAFLVIAVAGGPFSAALLAAAVLLAAQELVRLLLRLLTGPILDQLDKVLGVARDLTARLREVLADQASLVRAQSPARLLQTLAFEMRVIQDVVPQEFLNAAAALLGEARNAVLSTATDLALAAEQAVGHENATAFEAVAPGYDADLARAPMLPGGADPRRHGGAALLRDLARLEEQRTALGDGKEVELTHRLSLFRLLGGQGNPLAPTVAGAFPSFLANGEVVVRVTQGDVIDRMFPGVYRALVKDVRVSAVLPAAIGGLAGTTSSIPLTVTHLGESRTRVKRTANPAKPPLELPVCDAGPVIAGLPSLDPTSGAPVTRRVRLEEWLVVGPGGLQLRAELADLFLAAAATALDAALESVPPGAVAALGAGVVAAILLAILLGLPFDDFIDAVVTALREPYVRAIRAGLPTAVAREVERRSCGFVDSAEVKAGVEKLLFVFGLDNVDVLGPVLSWTLQDFETRQHQTPPAEVFASAVQPLLAALRNGASVPARGTAASVPDLVTGAYRDARNAHEHRMARWGRSRLEEDRDPQVRQLGFATLVREQQPEAAVFNLVSAGAPFLTGGQGVVLPAASPLPPSTATTLQYRPFENRGIEGSFLFRLGDKMLPTLPVAGSPASLTELLKDVVIDVTVHGCYDASLAAALRSSRQQDLDALKAFLPALPSLPPILGVLTSDRVSLTPRASERRTVHFSLRSHREKTRRQWLAVLGSTDPLLVAARNLLTTLLPPADQVPLDPNQAFKPLGAVGDELAFEFTFGDPPSLPPTPTEASLLELARTLTISRAALGVTPVLAGQVGAPGHVCAVGVAVIPMPAGTKPVGGGSDPLNLRLGVPAPLRPFLGLPAGTTDVAVPQRLRLTADVETVADDGTPIGLPFPAPSLDELFAAPGGTTIAVKVAGPAVTGNLVYDVVLSVSYYVRSLAAATTHSAVR